MKVRIRSWIAPGLWIVLIFTISSIPVSSIEVIYAQLESPVLRFLLSDPVTHIVMFGILAFLLGRSFWKNFRLMDNKNLILWAFLGAFLASFLLALAIEVYQQLVIPGRAFEIEDLIWNLVGIGAAVGYLSITFASRTRKSPRIS